MTSINPVGMSEEFKRAAVEWFTRALDNPECRIVLSRPAIRTTQPGDEWDTFAPSKTKYLLVAVGPESQPLENTVGALLAGDAGFDHVYAKLQGGL